MRNEDALPSYSISPEIVNKITWDKPAINFGLPDKRVKEIYDKINKKQNLSQENFGSISAVIRSPSAGNTLAFNENISTGICKVFWDKETNEVLKIIDKKIYAHYDATNNMPLPFSQIAIDQDTLKRCDVDLSSIDLNTGFDFPKVPNECYDKSIDSDIYDEDEYNEYLEQLLNCKLKPCPIIPQSYNARKSNISAVIRQSDNLEPVSDDADISCFSDIEKDEKIEVTTKSTDETKKEQTTVKDVCVRNVQKSSAVLSRMPTQSNTFNTNRTFQQYSVSKRQGISDLKFQIATLQIELNSKLRIINDIKHENEILKKEVSNKEKIVERNIF